MKEMKFIQKTGTALAYLRLLQGYIVDIEEKEDEKLPSDFFDIIYNRLDKAINFLNIEE
jgi:hypothetical protein